MKNKKKTKQLQNPYQGQKCARCAVAFTETDEVLVCGDCGKAYHRQCWEDKGCATADCVGTPDTEKSYSPKTAEPKQESEQTEAAKNPYAGKHCPRCNVAFTETDKVIVCSECGVPMHEQCWEDNGGCVTTGCKGLPKAAFPSEARAAPKKKRITTKLLAIYGGIVAVACVVVGVLFWQKILCIHKWQPATCTVAETCARCDKTRGDALGHEWGEADCVTPETCSRCGETQGTALGHEWESADCLTPKTCSRCGETEGKALGHDWTDATCDKPETCSRCGETQGEALGHNWQAATCDKPKTCSRCGETEGDALGHDWQEATMSEPKTCKRCGKTEGSVLGYTAVDNMTGQINCHGGTVASFSADYVCNNGACEIIRNSLKDGCQITAKHTYASYGLRWYEVWDANSGAYYGWVDSTYIDFTANNDNTTSYKTSGTSARIDCHGGTVIGFTTNYVCNGGACDFASNSISDSCRVIAKDSHYSYGLTWYEIWDAETGKYYGWVDSNYLDFD